MSEGVAETTDSGALADVPPNPDHWTARCRVALQNFLAVAAESELRIAHQRRRIQPHAFEGAEPGGLGLIGIRERVDSVGGNVHIQSYPDRGTQLHIDIPVGG